MVICQKVAVVQLPLFLKKKEEKKKDFCTVYVAEKNLLKNEVLIFLEMEYWNHWNRKN